MVNDLFIIYMYNKSILICISLAFIVGGLVSRPINVRAENRLFITGITLAAGEDAYDSLEDAGYHVLSVGLNVSVAGEKQVYIGYKMRRKTHTLACGMKAAFL